MNILVVTQLYYPEIGAAPSRLTNMVLSLKEAGHKVSVLTAMPNYPQGKIFEDYMGRFMRKECADGVNVYRYWIYATKSINPFIRIWGMISFSITMLSFLFERKINRQFDLVIIQTPPLFVGYTGVVMYKKIYKKKVLLNISDCHPQSFLDSGLIKKGSVYHKLLAYMERFIYKYSDGFMGQSQEILDHVLKYRDCQRIFLYRNLQKNIEIDNVIRKKNKRLKLVYAGLFGRAQDILSIVRSINYKELDVELHLYGGGNQQEEIEQYIAKKDTNVFYHGMLSKEKMVDELAKYDASIVPLIANLTGAVPSKIFDLMKSGIPIIFCGNCNGEAAMIIKGSGIGFVSLAREIDSLYKNIVKLKNMSEDEYGQMVDRCIALSKGEFNFEKQFVRFDKFIKDEFELGD